MNKRDLIIVALATFCLTSTLFMILPSRSAERDPWADVSGPTIGEPDGTINMRDINYEIQHFNQNVSNMTRNVNVTNWQSQDKVVWVGDFLAGFGVNFGESRWLALGEYPVHVGGFEKMTIVFLFPDNGAYLNLASPRYIRAGVTWYLQPNEQQVQSEEPSTTLYQVHSNWIHLVSVDSYPIISPYVGVSPDYSSVNNDNGNLTISIYLYLSNGPITSSTRKTMSWSEWRANNSSAPVTMGINVRGFTTFTVALHSNVTWSGQISLGYTYSESLSLIAYSTFVKTYELEGEPIVSIYLDSPSATPSYLSASFSVIA